MGRHARLVVPEVALHAVQRGNNRQDCFHHDNDRLVYLSLLKDAARLRQCAIHAYCLMTNHVHLLFTPPQEKACSLMMRDLGREYAAYFNRRYARTGSLWERPFKSCPLGHHTYLLRNQELALRRLCLWRGRLFAKMMQCGGQTKECRRWQAG